MGTRHHLKKESRTSKRRLILLLIVLTLLLLASTVIAKSESNQNKKTEKQTQTIEHIYKQSTYEPPKTVLESFPRGSSQPTIKTQSTSFRTRDFQKLEQSNDGLSAKMFIYLKESGNNPSSINTSSGACGLGQALPCSKLPCALGDYECQDNWFTNNYMIPRYGTWENAKAFWLGHGWW